MGILTWVVFGLVAGALTNVLMPGHDPGGLVVTIVLGIVGGVMGGYLGTMLGVGGVNTFDFRSLILAIGGAMMLLVAYRMLTKETTA